MHRNIIDRDLGALTGAFELALAPILDEDLDLITGNQDAPDGRILEAFGIEPRTALDPVEDWDGRHHS